MQPTIRRTASPIAALVWMLLFGFVFLGAAVALYFGDQIPSSWIRENGTITSYTTSVGGASNQGPSYCAVVTYIVKGAHYSATGHSCGGGIPSVGAPAQVAYNPNNPSNAKVVGGIGDIYFIGLAGLVGLALLVFAPVAYRRAKNSGPGPASVFTTQWPHVPNGVVTTTMPPTGTQPPAPVNPVQPVTPPPPAPPAPSTDQPAQPPPSTDSSNPPV
jgi:hypothetical protein